MHILQIVGACIHTSDIPKFHIIVIYLFSGGGGVGVMFEITFYTCFGVIILKSCLKREVIMHVRNNYSRDSNYSRNKVLYRFSTIRERSNEIL